MKDIKEYLGIIKEHLDTLAKDGGEINVDLEEINSKIETILINIGNNEELINTFISELKNKNSINDLTSLVSLIHGNINNQEPSIDEEKIIDREEKDEPYLFIKFQNNPDIELREKYSLFAYKILEGKFLGYLQNHILAIGTAIFIVAISIALSMTSMPLVLMLVGALGYMVAKIIQRNYSNKNRYKDYEKKYIDIVINPELSENQKKEALLKLNKSYDSKDKRLIRGIDVLLAPLFGFVVAIPFVGLGPFLAIFPHTIAPFNIIFAYLAKTHLISTLMIPGGKSLVICVILMITAYNVEDTIRLIKSGLGKIKVGLGKFYRFFKENNKPIEEVAGVEEVNERNIRVISTNSVKKDINQQKVEIYRHLRNKRDNSPNRGKSKIKSRRSSMSMTGHTPSI